MAALVELFDGVNSDFLRWIAKLPVRSTSKEVWNTCSRGDWLLELVGVCGITEAGTDDVRDNFVKAVCKCAELSLRQWEENCEPGSPACYRNGPRRDIETALAWVNGKATSCDLDMALRYSTLVNRGYTAPTMALHVAKCISSGLAPHSAYVSDMRSAARARVTRDTLYDSEQLKLDPPRRSVAHCAAAVAISAAHYAELDWSLRFAEKFGEFDVVGAKKVRDMRLAEAADIVRSTIQWSVVEQALADRLPEFQRRQVLGLQD